MRSRHESTTAGTPQSVLVTLPDDVAEGIDLIMRTDGSLIGDEPGKPTVVIPPLTIARTPLPRSVGSGIGCRQFHLRKNGRPSRT